MNTCEQLEFARMQAYVHSSFAPVCVCMCVCWPVCTVGWPGKDGLSAAGTSLAFLSPKVP